ncbi:DUF3761 domain-containing protein [Actinomadura violacea]|uniref:DUF3761 domain-containing protein n=1 Tax=Actinomadura violacea TaxID=2819934 RepID=A0ABS3S0Y1_9ACTN|nr:DUF3761 domain-containing protein [Actinomadura violacea]MBO2462660.1 DUF3761 domain-containing protein [Actinomadura violacea]
MAGSGEIAREQRAGDETALRIADKLRRAALDAARRPATARPASHSDATLNHRPGVARGSGRRGRPGHGRRAERRVVRGVGGAADLPKKAVPARPTYPAGASAVCRDGTLSYSAHRRGTCSHHRGVARWL